MGGGRSFPRSDRPSASFLFPVKSRTLHLIALGAHTKCVCLVIIRYTVGYPTKYSLCALRYWIRIQDTQGTSDMGELKAWNSCLPTTCVYSFYIRLSLGLPTRQDMALRTKGEGRVPCSGHIVFIKVHIST